MEQGRVPTTTKSAPPIIVNTVNERSRRKRGFRAEVTYGAQACRVFQFSITNGLLCFISQQPRRRDKTAWIESERTELISCCGDAPQSFLVAQIVELPFVLSIKSGHEFVAQSFFFLRRAFVKKTVDHDFVSVRFQRSEPCHEFSVLGERSLVMIIRHHKNRTNAHAVRAQFRNNRTCDLLSARGDIVQ